MERRVRLRNRKPDFSYSEHVKKWPEPKVKKVCFKKGDSVLSSVSRTPGTIIEAGLRYVVRWANGTELEADPENLVKAE